MSLLKFDPLVNLFKSKHRLEQELSELKGKAIEAETALSHCEILERQIDALIATIKSRIGGNQRSDVRQVRAFERLKQDLPAIRPHWEKRRRALAA